MRILFWRVFPVFLQLFGELDASGGEELQPAAESAQYSQTAAHEAPVFLKLQFKKKWNSDKINKGFFETIFIFYLILFTPHYKKPRGKTCYCFYP